MYFSFSILFFSLHTLKSWKRRCQNCGSGASAQPPRNALFQDLQDGRRRSFGWLADQQMNVLGHDHVSDQRKVKPAPHLAKDLYECVSRTDRAEQRQAAVATACDEVQVFLPVVAPQSFGHPKNQKPHPCKNRKDGAPPSYHSPTNYRGGILSPTLIGRKKRKTKEERRSVGHPSLSRPSFLMGKI